MIGSLLIFALVHAGTLQINPPGTSVLPSQAAFYSVTGGTANVEVRDSTGLPVPFVDAIGVKRSAVTITLPAGTAVGLGWELTQTKPDGSNALTPIGQSQYSLVVTMNCSATESPVGTYDSSAGVGNGVAAGYPAPTASTPTAFASGVTYSIRVGSVVSVVAPAPTALASGSLRSNGLTYLTTYSTGGEASNKVTSTATALTLSNGGDPSAPYYVVITNTGTVDAWVAPVSGNHTWICPAGTTTYIPFGGSTLYGLANSGSTTLCVTKVGY